MLLGSGPSSAISRLVMPPARNSARDVPTRVEHPVQDVVARLRDLQRLGQQMDVVVHHDTARAQHVGERVVLGLRPAHPQHVIEQQVGGVVRSQALEFEAWAVQDHLPQAADLRVHAEHGTPVLMGPVL